MAVGLCPMTGTLPEHHPRVPSVVGGRNEREVVPVPADYTIALDHIDFSAVKTDLKALFVDSKPWWPADYGTYAPFFVRLAWHCSGSYRSSDGRGGCSGGRQRFEPERSWDDNTNLDKDMGGPTLGFCAGRVDAADGTESEALGPSALQEELHPCKMNGNCSADTGLGSTTIGLIYLNPEGPLGQPIPNETAPTIRKTHGACPDGAGPSPKEDPLNPWPGKCGSGVGADAFTSGFEGPWTVNPTQWDN
eukprot:gene22879-17432_t